MVVDVCWATWFGTLFPPDGGSGKIMLPTWYKNVRKIYLAKETRCDGIIGIHNTNQVVYNGLQKKTMHPSASYRFILSPFGAWCAGNWGLHSDIEISSNFHPFSPAKRQSFFPTCSQHRWQRLGRDGNDVGSCGDVKGFTHPTSGRHFCWSN